MFGDLLACLPGELLPRPVRMELPGSAATAGSTSGIMRVGGRAQRAYVVHGHGVQPLSSHRCRVAAA
eukprot:387622-Lingulodinium_polyedra.AAC.1